MFLGFVPATTSLQTSQKASTAVALLVPVVALGLPIASGAVEGACKNLVKDRMELPGARWSLDGAEAILRLRALRVSGDFEDYMAFHRRQERKRNYSSVPQNDEFKMAA